MLRGSQGRQPARGRPSTSTTAAPEKLGEALHAVEDEEDAHGAEDPRELGAGADVEELPEDRGRDDDEVQPVPLVGPVALGAVRQELQHDLQRNCPTHRTSEVRQDTPGCSCKSTSL